MKDILLSNFQSPKKTLTNHGQDEMLSQHRPTTTRRNIFNERSSTNDVFSLDGFTSFSPPRESGSFSPSRRRACKRLRLSESEDMNSQSKSLPSENTLDWLADIERDNKINEKDVRTPPSNLSFHDALEKSNTPEHNASPSFHGKKVYDGLNFVDMKQSPTVVRAGNEQIAVSPLLSISSIEMLESAPILSPVSKRKREKKRRTLAMD